MVVREFIKFTPCGEMFFSEKMDLLFRKEGFREPLVLEVLPLDEEC